MWVVGFISVTKNWDRDLFNEVYVLTGRILVYCFSLYFLYCIVLQCIDFVLYCIVFFILLEVLYFMSLYMVHLLRYCSFKN